MGENKPQGNPTSGQHGHTPGREPADIDRGSFEPGSNTPGGDGRPSEPEPAETNDQPRKGEKTTRPVNVGNEGDEGGTS